MRLKPIQLRKSFSCDILIFDDIGATWLSKVVPDFATCGYLSTRFCYPVLINIGFLRRLFLILLGSIFHRNATPYYSYLDALIKSIKPKIVMTAADNNATLAVVSKTHTSILFLYIQSALRDEHSFPKIHDLPVYCSFGYIEKRLFNDLNINCQAYWPIGSVKLGIAMSKEPTENDFQSSDICFISSHRPKDQGESSAISDRINDVDQILFVYSIRFARRSNLTIKVLGKARENKWQRKELAHYKKLAGGYPFDYITTDKNAREFASYHALLNSELTIHCGSTLGFEALSVGKKVLFGATMDMAFINDWGVRYYYLDMPRQIRLQKDSFEHFSEKLDYLRKIPLNDFLELTSRYSHQIMKNHSSLKPHEVLPQKLARDLDQYSDSVLSSNS